MNEQQWQPIETAPHEEMVILGWFFDGTFIQEINMYSRGERWDDGHYLRSSMSYHGRATHWMNLPKPPGEQS